MPMVCVVYGCSNRSNRETTRSFYRVPKVVVHKGEKCKTLTGKRRQTWLLNLGLRPGVAESDNARVCSDHFVKVNLGYPMSEASCQPEDRTKSTDDQRRLQEGAEALLDLHQSAEKPEDVTETLHDEGCQTDLTMDDIQRMEDALKQQSWMIFRLKHWTHS
ncbi:hypothetical protein PAMA_014576 [Pampus argenteus]